MDNIHAFGEALAKAIVEIGGPKMEYVADDEALLFEDGDKLCANDAPLALRLGHPAQRGEEAFLRPHMDQAQGRERAGKRGGDLLRLRFPLQPVIDEDGRETASDGTVHQRRRHRTVHASGQGRDCAPGGTDRLSDRRRRLVGIPLHAPGGAQGANAEEEVAQDLQAKGRVRHLGVELDPVDSPCGIGDHRHRGAGRARTDHEPGRRLQDQVSVAHPHPGACREAGEHSLGGRDLHLGTTVFRMRRTLHAASEGMTEKLVPITDAQQRQPGTPEGGVGPRCTLSIHACRTAAQNCGGETLRLQLLRIGVTRTEFARDTAFSDAPGDELRVLRTEIQDGDAFSDRC
jgi:hypothetical protein